MMEPGIQRWRGRNLSFGLAVIAEWGLNRVVALSEIKQLSDNWIRPRMIDKAIMQRTAQAMSQAAKATPALQVSIRDESHQE
jgi:hypothetical protein